MTDVAPGTAGTVEARWPVDVVRGLPLALALVALVWIAADDGGFEATTWYPAALLVTAVLAVTTLALPDAPLRGAALLASLALGGFALWSYASILWADDRGAAWHGANLTLFYAVVFLLFASCRPSERTVAWGLTVFAATIAALGLVTVWRASRSEAAADVALLYGRLSSPTGYANATASLFALSGWVALGLAAARSVPRIARCVALASAGVAFGLCVVAQSRGWIFTTPVVLIVFLVLYPRRLQAAAAAAVVALVLAPALPILLDVFRADGAERPDALADVAVALGIAAAVLAAVGAALPLLDRLELSVAVRRVLLVVGVVLAIGGLAAFAVRDDPAGRVRTGWHQFTQDRNAASSGSHFVGLGSNRYDFWRVGLGEFRRHPIVGVGSDNFAIPYIAARRSGEQPLHPHSLWVRTLSQTGLVGAALLAVAVGAALWAVLRRNRHPVQVALVTAFVAWLLHAQGDWLWEMPAVGAIAFGLLGVAVGLSSREAPSPGGATRRAWPWVVVGCAALGALALAPPWLAARYEVSALAGWRTAPDAAIEDLRRAASLNPLSDRPWVIAGAIASRHDDYPAMRRHFAAAVERNPRNWYSRLELAVAAALTGDRRLALSEVSLARALNPNDAVLARVARTIRSGGVPDPVEIDAEYREQTEAIAG